MRFSATAALSNSLVARVQGRGAPRRDGPSSALQSKRSCLLTGIRIEDADPPPLNMQRRLNSGSQPRDGLPSRKTLAKTDRAAPG
eukprot:5627280-Pyramimonas_sp.AAC.1